MRDWPPAGANDPVLVSLKLIALIFILSCLPALADPLADPSADPLPAQGNGAIVSGRAHVERAAQGTYIHIDAAGDGTAVTGYIPFGHHGSYPDLDAIDGHQITMTGVVLWDGRAMITLTDPRQLTLG
jgi:hypothetical protein